MINSSLSVPGKVTAITIEKECGKHSTMEICIVPDSVDGITELRNFVSCGTSVEADIDGMLVMCGKIKEITGKSTYAGAAVSVFVVSDSLASDMIKISRIFQSPKKTYGEICGKISEKVTFTISNRELASKKEEAVVVQYNESDFAFANRLAIEHHTRLFVIDAQRGKNEVVIADNLQTSKQLKNTDLISAELQLSEQQETLEIEYREYIELGTKVQIENNEYVVVHLKVNQIGDGVRYFYRIERIQKEIEADKNPVELFSLGTAKIVNNQDSDHLGRIQVEFSELEDAMKDEKIWIPYINTLTAKEGGIFFIPDVDEQVQVIYQNGTCYAYGCVRTQAASDKINNTDNKSILLYNKTFVIEKQKITLMAGDYTIQIDEEAGEASIKNAEYYLNMKKDSIVTGNSNNTVQIDKDKVEINTNQKGIVTVKSSEIAINVNQKGIITAKDTAVQIFVNQKGKLEITDRQVKSTAGNGMITLESGKLSIDAASTVDVKTKKMNIT